MKPHMGAIIEGAGNVKFARLLVLRQALRLEIAGMRRRGRSAYSLVKEELEVKGSRQRVLQLLNEHIDSFEEQDAV